MAEGFTSKLYSRMETAIANYPAEKAQGKQWLKALSTGVNAREVKWTGLDRFLTENSDRVVTRGEIADFVSQNPVELEETMLTGKDARWGPGGRVNVTPNIPGATNYREAVISFRQSRGRGRVARTSRCTGSRRTRSCTFA
jgi:hypothetical protein